MFTWIKNNKLATAGIAIVLIYVIASLVKKEWNPMNWFAAVPGAGTRACPPGTRAGTQNGKFGCFSTTTN